jgi:DNA polymerase-3 subunit epsilon
LHGALLDAEILADVYLLMTGGQTTLFGGSSGDSDSNSANNNNRVNSATFNGRKPGVVIRASEEEQAMHEARLNAIDKASGGNCLYKKEA